MKNKLLIFHPVIAPYRIDFFNKLYKNFNSQICLFQRNLLNQKFDYDKIYNQFDFKPIYLEEFYKIPFIRIRKGIIKTIKEFNPNIVLVSEYRIETIIIILYKILLRKKFKIISIVDDSYDMILNNNHFSKRHKYAEKLVLPFLDNVINVEPRVSDFFKRKYNKGVFFPIIQDETKIRFKYNDVLNISTTYINKYNLHDYKVILFVGRLDKVKNLENLINNFKRANLTNCKLVIVGDGELKNSLTKISTPDIIFTGRLEGDYLYAWYNIAEIFILPSIKEAFGAVTNEALLGGCFSLISDKAGSNCLIKQGINGYVFNPSDSIEFINILKKSTSEISLRNYPLKLRDSKMLYSFEYYIKELIKVLNN